MCVQKDHSVEVIGVPEQTVTPTSARVISVRVEGSLSCKVTRLRAEGSLEHVHE